MALLTLSDKELNGFTNVWKQLLKIKVWAIYEIAKEQKVNFKDLLDEFLPEAMENKDLWQDEYILDNSIKVEKDIPKKITKSKPMKLKLKKKKLKFKITS